MRLSSSALHAVVLLILRAMGSEATEADIVATHLVESNLRGHDSHGVGMLPSYIRNWQAGKLRCNRHAEFVRIDGVMAVIDGHMGFGQVIAGEAMNWAITCAGANGLALFTLRHTQHIGRVGTYAEQACRAGFISISFVNSIAGAPRVAPFGGSDGRMSTEPLCIGVPTSDPAAPVILDFATSQVALGKMRVAYNEGRTVGDGILIDAAGQPSNDPGVLYNEPKGAVLPFGAHKGSGLALVCGLLGGALSGGGTMQPQNARDLGSVNGMFCIVVDPARLVDLPWFQHEVDALIAYVKASPASLPGGAVLVAGEPERATRASRLREGIEIDATSWRDLRDGAITLGIPPEALDALQVPRPD